MARVLQGDVRARILEAAKERLWYYGFKKTTIDEIAADAGVGKGTVYLYFESKEDIALAIMAQYKEQTVTEIQDIAKDQSRTPTERVKEILIRPLESAHNMCKNSPAALEIIVAIKTHLRVRMRPYIEHEIALIAQVLEEGNQQGIYDIQDTLNAARSLKLMTYGFWPPYPCVTNRDEIRPAIEDIIDLVVKGLRK